MLAATEFEPPINQDYSLPIGSKVASVSHSPPPTTKKPHLHTTMSVPANLTHEGYESKHDSSIVEVSTNL